MVNDDKNEIILKINNISDYYITRFSTIKFFNLIKKKKVAMAKAGEDFIRI